MRLDFAIAIVVLIPVAAVAQGDGQREVYSVVAAGAIPDDANPDTDAINAALTSALTNGGGVSGGLPF